jgi:hypothetical protein
MSLAELSPCTINAFQHTEHSCSQDERDKFFRPIGRPLIVTHLQWDHFWIQRVKAVYVEHCEDRLG